MTQAALDPNLDMIIANLRDSFIDDAGDKMDEIEAVIDAIDDKQGRYEHQILEVQRIAHSLKGSAGSFGFMSITRISHAFEDFIDVTTSHMRLPIPETRKYIEAIRLILQQRKEPSDEETAMMLDELPAPIHPGAAPISNFRGKAMLLMPSGVQRKIISRELGIFGLRTTVFDGTMDALDFILTGAVDIAFVSMQLNRITGIEFARIMQSIERTSDIRVAILSASTDQTGELDIPDNAVIIPKGPTFSRDLLSFISDAGFGALKATGS